jgi:nitrogen fixation NifU-like protein
MSDSHGHDSQRVLDHFLNPRNVGDLPGADGVGEVGAVACGDVVRISIKVSEGRIAEARFRAYGCGTVIACSSVTTELLRGQSVAEAGSFSNEQVANALGGLPATKAHCPVLAEEAVKSAVADYLRRRKT